MSVIKNIVLSVSLTLLFLSCASVAHYEQIDASVARGDFRGGLELVNAAKDTAYREKDKVLYYLDAGMLAHYAGEYDEAAKLLGEAERNIEAAFTKSVSQEVASYLVNDTTKEYPGEDYEDLYLNVFNALNYYYKGSVEGALVEVRRIDNKLKFISTKYGTAITNAQKAILDKSSEIPYDPEAATVRFSNSALARYISMLFYRGEGKRDSARIDRDQVKLAFASQPAVYDFKLPASLDSELDVPRGKARLNVVSINGLSPIKTENTTRINLNGTNWIKIALPVITGRPSAIARTEVALENGETFNLELLENMGAVAAETFRQKAGLIYLKTVLRSITKTGSSIALNEQSDKAGDAQTALLLSVLSLSTQIYAEASEQADLRLSRYFPSSALVGGINLDPGVYSYTVRYYNSANQLISEIPFRDVQIRANALNLTEAICIK